MEELNQKLHKAKVLTGSETILEKKDVIRGQETYLFTDQEGDVKLLWLIKDREPESFLEYKKRMKENDTVLPVSGLKYYESREGLFTALRTEFYKPFSVWMKERLVTFGFIPEPALWSLLICLWKAGNDFSKKGISYPCLTRETVFYKGFLKPDFCICDLFAEDKNVHDRETYIHSIGKLLYIMQNGTVCDYEELMERLDAGKIREPVCGSRSWKKLTMELLQYGQNNEEDEKLEEQIRVMENRQNEAEADFKYGKNLWMQAEEEYLRGRYEEAEKLAECPVSGWGIPFCRLQGCILLKQGKKEEALDHFEEAADQGDPVSAAYLSGILFSTARSRVDFKEAARYGKQAERAGLLPEDYR